MVTLRPYQVEARDFLIERSRAILADRRGLGKTFPALAAAVAGRDQAAGWYGFVTPAYLQHHAVHMIRSYFGEDVPVTLVNRGDPRPDLTSDRPHWVVIGYPTLTHGGIKKTPWVTDTYFQAVIFDEAHHLRNRHTQWVAYAKEVTVRSRRVYFLTGTPIVRSPADLWAPLNLLYPKRFGGYWSFAERWCQILETPWSREPLGLRPGLEEAWQEFLAPFLLRRTSLSLPDPVEHEIIVPMLPAQAHAYKRARDAWVVEVGDDETKALQSIGELLVTLRGITAGLGEAPWSGAASPKVRAALELIAEIETPVVVWCWHRATAQMLSHLIAHTLQRPVQCVTGDVPAQERWGKVQEWTGWGSGVLVATILSLPEGIDLFHAADCIFFEQSYLWAHLDQAIGRIHREGQTSPVVNVYYLGVDKTIDLAVIRAARRRESVAERALVAYVKGS